MYRDCIWSLHVQRDPTYYIFKGAVPIYVIVAFAFFQFAMDVDAQLTERLNFLVALMLSSFAIQWTVTDRLPRVPFVTALDRLIFASLLALYDGPWQCSNEPGRLQRQARRVRLRRYQTNPNVGQGVLGRDARRLSWPCTSTFSGVYARSQNRKAAHRKLCGFGRSWRCDLTPRCPRGRGRRPHQEGAIEGTPWRCDLTREMKSSGR